MADSSIRLPTAGGEVVTLRTDLSGDVHTLLLAGLGAAIRLTPREVEWDAGVGDLVGTLSVVNGNGSYTFTIDVNTYFDLDGADDTLLEVKAALDYDVAPLPQSTIQADNGVDPPLEQTFVISVIVYAPSAFEVADWDLDAGNTEAEVTINSLPVDGGTDITDIQYRIDGGAWVSSGGTTSFTITGLTNSVEYDVELHAVNAIGAGAAGDLKAVTPSALLEAPVLTITSDETDNTINWTLSVPSGVPTNAVQEVQVSDTSDFSGTPVEYEIPDASDNPAAGEATTPVAPGPWYLRGRWLSEDESTVLTEWSDVEMITIIEVSNDDDYAAWLAAA